MVPDAHPWWGSINEAEKAQEAEKAEKGADSAPALVDSFGEGFDKWPARWRRKLSLAVNPDHATQLVD